MYSKYFYSIIFFCLLLITSGCSNCNTKKLPWTKKSLLFEDSCTGNWQQKWMIDGTRSKVINTSQGMELIAGQEYGNDTCHTVLWTKQSFKGNICIEYDYTRTDTTTRCVNIIYFLATGKGYNEYPADISMWNDKRTVPHMSTYIKNMNTYHISYAAFDAKKYSKDNDYIRLRRYDPELNDFKRTNIPGDHFSTGLFKPNITYHIQIVKFNNLIEMLIQNKNKEEEKLKCKWDVSNVKQCKSGRIGLRHMYTRSARYKNFKVWEIDMSE